MSPALPTKRPPLTAERVAPLLAAGTPYNRTPISPAKFKVGDEVHTIVAHPTTHTRLPRYARGKTGVITEIHDVFVFPDSLAHGKGEDPQWCYGVRFDGRKLWGPDSDPHLEIIIDLFEPYLMPAA